MVTCAERLPCGFVRQLSDLVQIEILGQSGSFHFF